VSLASRYLFHVIEKVIGFTVIGKVSGRVIKVREYQPEDLVGRLGQLGQFRQLEKEIHRCEVLWTLTG